MSFATDDLREEILDLFIAEHNKINDFSYVHADLTLIDMEKRRENDRKRRILDLAWERRDDRERKNMARFKTPETVKCPVCDNSMLSFVTNGHPRKFCSDKCRLKEQWKRSRQYKKARKCANQKQAQ